MRMTGTAEGVPFDDDVRLTLRDAFPDGKIALTRGRHYSLEEERLYLVRSGPEAVIMPRMVYSPDVVRAVLALYGEENEIVGNTERSAACSDHP